MILVIVSCFLFEKMDICTLKNQSRTDHKYFKYWHPNLPNIGLWQPVPHRIWPGLWQPFSTWSYHYAGPWPHNSLAIAANIVQGYPSKLIVATLFVLDTLSSMCRCNASKSTATELGHGRSTQCRMGTGEQRLYMVPKKKWHVGFCMVSTGCCLWHCE